MSNNKDHYLVTLVSPALLDPFSHQARKIFHERDLGTLIESIRERGISQPLIARPAPNNAKRLELVAGERRLRAARELGLAEVPVIIRQLNDEQAEEESLTENLARVNLTPVEEANAFKRMLELTAHEGGGKLYTILGLAKKIGREEWEIRQALKVLNAPDLLLKEIDMPKDERRIPVSVVEVIGRIPDPRAREKAAQDVMRGASLNGGAASGKPLTLDETRKLVRARYMAKIDVPQDDATLLPMKTELVNGLPVRVCGGPCKDCPFRSGNLEDIADSLRSGSATDKGGEKAGIDVNICTKPSCLQSKRDELWSRKKDQHLKDGGRVLTDAESKKEFSYEDRLRYDSPYAKLSEKPEPRVFPGKYDLGTWAQLTKGLPVIVTLARVPDLGKEVKLITVKEAAELVRARWKEAPKDEDSKEAAEAKAARAKELRAEKIEKELVKQGLAEIGARVTKTGLSVDQWREFFGVILANAGSDGMTVLGQWLEIKLPKGGHHSGRDYEDEILKLVAAKVTTANGWLAWCVLASVARGIKYAGANGADYKTMIEALEIDVKPLKVAAAQVVEAKLKKPEGAKKAEKPKPLVNDGMVAGTTLSGAKAETVYDASAAAADDNDGPIMKAAKRGQKPSKALVLSGDEDEVAALLKEWGELKKPTQAEGKEARKAWDAARKRISRALVKLGAEVPAK